MRGEHAQHVSRRAKGSVWLKQSEQRGSDGRGSKKEGRLKCQGGSTSTCKGVGFFLKKSENNSSKIILWNWILKAESC